MTELQNLKLLITGGAGQIGSALIEKIVSISDAKIYLIERRIKKSSALFYLIKKRRVEFLKCDLQSPVDISKIRNSLINAKIDVLIHLASHIFVSRDIIRDAPDDIQLNILGTINLLSYLSQNLKQIIYPSSDSVYGKPFFLPVNEGHPTNPFHIYGASKLAAEKYLQIFAEYNNIPLSILRISGVYGPNTPKYRAIPIFIDNVLQNKPPIIRGDGKTIRDYIHVDDVVQAIMLAIEHKADGVYNIGTGKGQAIAEIARLIIKLSGKKLKLAYIGDRNDYSFVFDISLAQRKLGFEPRVKFEDGISSLLDRLKQTKSI